MKLSNQQTEAKDLIMKWLNSEGAGPTFALSGYAGTGKTTLARIIADEVGQDNTVFCAYTGKAASILHEKGCQNSGTIHSYLYKLDGKNQDGSPIFKRVPKDESAFYHARLVVCDEYSMLPNEILDDIISTSRKILFLGDPFQLPPVRGENKIKADYMLTDVQRQALESPIIRYATKVRQNESFSYLNEAGFIYTPKSKVDKQTYFDVDQTIVGRNKTRVQWNEIFRKRTYDEHFFEFDEYDFKDGGKKEDAMPFPEAKLICLKNNKTYGIYNGQIGYSLEVRQKKRNLDFLCNESVYPMLPFANDAWQVEKPDIWGVKKETCVFDYGYAITCHKAQGSEFNSVIINNECFGDTDELKRRWTYTAITRAINSCILMDPYA